MGSPMSAILSVREAQAQLPDLVARVAKGSAPCTIRRRGRPVAILVSLAEWRRRTKDERHAAAAKDQQRRLRAYQIKMNRLGPEYRLAPGEQAQLKELVEREDSGEPLTGGERRELRQLLRRQEELMVKRALAMQAME